MGRTTFGQDIFNAITIKKPWYIDLLKFVACVCFGMVTSWAFGTTISLTVTICSCLFIFFVMDYSLYINNINNCQRDIEKDSDLVEEAFDDNQFYKDSKGVLFNVYKLYFQNRKSDLRFSILEYGKTEEEIWTYWSNCENVRKNYLLYKVELIKKRRPEEKKNENSKTHS